MGIMNPASNLILIGPMGAGKTSIGRRLAQQFGLRFVDADQAVVERSGAAIATIFEHVGERGFREREKAILGELLDGEGVLVSTGGGAVLDFDNRQRMRQRGFVVHLQVSVESQLKRLGRDRSRPLLQHGDPEQVLRTLASVREPLYAEIADLVLDTDGMSPGAAAMNLARLLAGRWRRPGQAA
jgi:shikimate kinase